MLSVIDVGFPLGDIKVGVKQIERLLGFIYLKKKERKKKAFEFSFFLFSLGIL